MNLTTYNNIQKRFLIDIKDIYNLTLPSKLISVIY